MKCTNNILQKTWAQLIAWQILSILSCCSGTICNVIAMYYETTIPLLMLSIEYTTILLASCWKVPKSNTPMWRYFVLSVCSLSGDYLSVLAFNNTSLGSAVVLINTMLFWVAPLAFFIFHRKLTIMQVFAIFLSIGGCSMIIVAEGTKDMKWLGNVFALGCAFCYAISGTFQEWTIHGDSLHSYWFRFSLGCSPLAIIMSGCIEWKTIRDYNWCWQSVLLCLGYSAISGMYNTFLPLIMQYSDVTKMNLSLLTSNFFSLGVSILFFGQKASWLYLVGFLCIPIAIVIFCVFEKKEDVPIDESLGTTSLISENSYMSLTDEKKILS